MARPHLFIYFQIRSLYGQTFIIIITCQILCVIYLFYLIKLFGSDGSRDTSVRGALDVLRAVRNPDSDDDTDGEGVNREPRGVHNVHRPDEQHGALQLRGRAQVGVLLLPTP